MALLEVLYLIAQLINEIWNSPLADAFKEWYKKNLTTKK